LPALLEIANLDKSFGSLRVLRSVGLSVEAGEVVTVCGASGSGKSTLLRCINGLETPDGGSIRFRGAEVPRTRTALRELRRHVGMVFQSFNLFPHLTALQNVSLGPSWRATCSNGSASVTRPTRSRTSCRAASSSGWRSPGRSPCSPR